MKKVVFVVVSCIIMFACDGGEIAEPGETLALYCNTNGTFMPCHGDAGAE